MYNFFQNLKVKFFFSESVKTCVLELSSISAESNICYQHKIWMVASLKTSLKFSKALCFPLIENTSSQKCANLSTMSHAFQMLKTWAAVEKGYKTFQTWLDFLFIECLCFKDLKTAFCDIALEFPHWLNEWYKIFSRRRHSGIHQFESRWVQKLDGENIRKYVTFIAGKKKTNRDVTVTIMWCFLLKKKTWNSSSLNESSSLVITIIHSISCSVYFQFIAKLLCQL